ncbi:MAG: threonylcarbamoyl-AMP synthase [Alphaproteobacteria bacterium]|nr:threonylcarbamoyl-AMP synthase [Alphaproteobacteria bacterium]
MTIYAPIQSTIEKAAALLREGDLVAFPTETVYGLGADATNDRAVAKIFAAKARPQFNPLIIHVPDLAAAQALGALDERARRLAERFWPGPLSIVVPRRPDCPVSRLATAGLDTLALRAPDHHVAQALLRAAGRPIAGPSANVSGRLSATTAAHVAKDLGRHVNAILDGGPCRIGLESTVVACLPARAWLLRPGAVTTEQISAVIGPLDAAPANDPERSPGQLLAHYAPTLPLRLQASSPKGAQEALLAFGERTPPGFSKVLNLSPTGDLVEAASHLFAFLHELDQPEFSGIAVMPIPERGLGVAINDRLRRAAHGSTMIRQ